MMISLIQYRCSMRCTVLCSPGSYPLRSTRGNVLLVSHVKVVVKLVVHNTAVYVHRAAAVVSARDKPTIFCSFPRPGNAHKSRGSGRIVTISGLALVQAA